MPSACTPSPRASDRFSAAPRGNAAPVDVSGRRLARVQAAYFGATGIWPLLHRRSFEAATGPKADYWLVQTVGALVATAGAALAVAARRESVSPEASVLAAGSAVALAAVDVVHAARGRIRRIYLADAAAELVLAAGWAAVSRPGQPRRRSTSERDSSSTSARNRWRVPDVSGSAVERSTVQSRP